MASHQPQDAVAPEHNRSLTTTSQDKIAREKRSFSSEAELPEPSTSSRRPRQHSRMMASLRGLLVVLTCLLVTLSLTLALTDDPRDSSDRDSAQTLPDDSPSTDSSTVQSLLDAVSPESLHEFLHQYFPNRFQHGVWESDRAAVEAVVVHPEDGPAVTSLVRMLRRDNTTTTTSSTSEPPPPPSSTTTTPLPTTTPGTTSTQGPTPSSSSPNPGSSSSSSGPGSTTTSNTSSRPPTSTTRRPQTNTFTSFVNGSPTIVTQTTYVDAIDTPSQSTIAASLQTNAAVAPGRRGNGMVDAAVAGAVVVGGVLFA